MNKKLLILGATASALLFVNPASWAQADLTSLDATAILEENALREATTRYTSLLVFFQPEEATRLGFEAGNDRLNDRSVQAQRQAQQALEGIATALKDINQKNLSVQKRSDYHLLQAALQRDLWNLQQNRLSTDPLYYAQALDAVYDLMMLSPKEFSRKQRTDLLKRTRALPTVYEQAKENLTHVSPRLAQMAMEKAYYAYLSFDTIKERITTGADFTNDARDNADLEASLQKAKSSVYDLFELFKTLSKQPQTDLDLLGTAMYTRKLQDYYQINDKSFKLETALNTAWDEAQHQLFFALRPFELSADDTEVTIVEDLNERPQEQLPTAQNTPEQITYVPPTANQFYAVAGQLVSPFEATELLSQFSKQVNVQEKALSTQQGLPSIPIQVQELLPYFSYQTAFLTYPAYATFWLRIPQGNELAKKQILDRDFNEPYLKRFITEEIVPGRYYQVQTQKDSIRRLFGMPTLANGWTLYALRLAQEAQIFVTDEELLFAAWSRFVRTISAVTDYRLHTQQYTYEDALAFLTEQNGFSSEQAFALLDEIVRQPGEAVSYLAGEMLWQQAAEKYLKKTKKSTAVNALLMEVGNVVPDDLNAELKRLYKK